MSVPTDAASAAKRCGCSSIPPELCDVAHVHVRTPCLQSLCVSFLAISLHGGCVTKADVPPRGGVLVDRRKTIDLINPMDYREVFSERVPKDVIELTAKSERLFKASVILVCGWALI